MASTITVSLDTYRDVMQRVKEGMSIEDISEETSVPVDVVKTLVASML